ncbi:hypothetical protein [Leifsonia sp. Root227]|nr:hypothetical protein [Leifsonia sp. Root227]
MTIKLEPLDPSQPIVISNARFVDDEHNDFLLGTPEHPGLFE